MILIYQTWQLLSPVEKVVVWTFSMICLVLIRFLYELVMDEVRSRI